VIRKVYLLCDPAAKERPVAHPHNAYLEQLLDTGAIGLAVTLALYGAALVTAIRLCREKRDVLAATVGGITLACVTALLVAGISGQTLWPSPSSVFLWCFCGILLRVWVTLRRARAIQYQSVLPQRLAAKSGRYSPASLDCPR
jgi:O-antigen ligase